MEKDKLVELVVAEVLKRMAAPEQSKVRVYEWRSLELTNRLLPLVQAWHGRDVQLVYNGEDGQDTAFVARILPFLSCTDMADIAAGTAHSETAGLVLQALLRGERIEVVDFEYLSHANSAPTALFAVYRKYEERLASYGLVRFREKMPETVRCQDNLILATALEEAAAAGVRTLIVANSAKITPLAAEAAARLGIAMVREQK